MLTAITINTTLEGYEEHTQQMVLWERRKEVEVILIHSNCDLVQGHKSLISLAIYLSHGAPF